MDKKQICVKFAREICDILEISVPDIKFVSADRMHTGTQIAALTPDAVLIRDDIAVSPELFFALAHELRHALEVDANAFGALIMSDFFGIVPQFRNMPDTVRKAIKDRMKQLQKEYT